jgi:hypothetical protein
MKNLVVESLNELYKFEKKSEPLDSLNIGKKALISKWLDDHEVIRYHINDDLTIDVDGSVFLYNDKIKELPEYIKFNEVNGDFDVSENNLVTLRGCPRFILGNFWCYDNAVEFSRDYIKSQGIGVEQNIFNSL